MSVTEKRTLARATFSNLPVELLENIFSFLDSKCLIKHCRPVCRVWKELIDEDILMRRALTTAKLRQIYQDKNLTFENFYQIEQTFGRNLIKNVHFEAKAQTLLSSLVRSFGASSNEAEIENWESRGSFVKEKPSAGTNGEPIPLHVLKQNGIQEMKELPVIATSYNYTFQWQEVELESCKISGFLMDEIMPTIVAEEWIGTRFDCGNDYTLTIELYKEKGDTPCFSKYMKVTSLAGGPGQWRKVSMRIRNYGKGVRRIKYIRGGQDNQFWAGFYGTKFALPSLTLHLPCLVALPDQNLASVGGKHKTGIPACKFQRR